MNCFFIEFWRNRFVLGQLTKRDFQGRYLGSYLGLPWAFVKPLAVVAVMWFAFTYGLKVGKVDDTIPFALWLMVGMIPWFYLSENVLGSSQSLMEYAFLIKHINIRPDIIPLVKILTNSMIHLFFIVVLAVVCLAYGYLPSIYWVQVFYYMGCGLLLTLGISWFFSAVQPFVRDMGHLLEVATQILFWGTPILWSYRMFPAKLCVYLKLNPGFYIIEGYRNTFIYQTWFFEDMPWTIYFWCVAFCVFIVGALVFKKLKPHFADVL